jgi:hypothetical protein
VPETQKHLKTTPHPARTRTKKKLLGVSKARPLWSTRSHSPPKQRKKICSTSGRFAKLAARNSIAASQPAAAKRTRAEAQRERERARPTLVLVCEREGQVVSQDLLRGNPSGSLFHFISYLQDTLVGPPRITLDCLHTLTSVAAKQKKQTKWRRKGSSSQQVFFRVFGVGEDFSHLITAAFPHTTNKPYKIPWLVISCNLNKL